MFDIISFGTEAAALMEEAVVLLGLLTSIGGYFFGKEKVKTKQMAQIMDQSSAPNSEFSQIANAEKLGVAAKEIIKILGKK